MPVQFPGQWNGVEPFYQVTSNDYMQYREEHQSGNKLRYEGKEMPSGRCFYEPDWETKWTDVATRLCRVDAGVSRRVDRLTCLGNAVVPQQVYPILKAIADIENGVTD